MKNLSADKDNCLYAELIDRAVRVGGNFSLGGFYFNSAGKVGCALISGKGNIYTGINIDIACSMGFCAEHAAIAEMLKNRETIIKTIVAVRDDRVILPPCGRCREFMYQIDPKNLSTKIIISKNKVVKLSELLPEPWAKIE